MLKYVYLEGLQPLGRSHTEVGGKCEEKASKWSCYGLPTVAHSPSLCAALRGEEVEESGMRE